MSYTRRWPRGGVLTVSSEGVAFEPSAPERRLGAEAWSVPASGVRAVTVEPRSVRRPMAWGAYRVLCLEIDGHDEPRRVGVVHGSEVAPIVPAVLAGSEDERAARRVERKVRRPVVSLWSGLAAASVLLLAQFGPVLWDDEPLGAGRVGLGVAAALVIIGHLVLLAWRGLHRTPE